MAEHFKPRAKNLKYVDIVLFGYTEDKTGASVEIVSDKPLTDEAVVEVMIEWLSDKADRVGKTKLH